MGIFGSSQAGQPRYSGELHNLQLTQAVFGTTATVIHGTDRVAAKLLFYGGFRAVNAPNSGGKGLGGGKGDQQYDYYADCQLGLASGSAAGGCQGILNVWDQQGKLQNQSGSYSYTIPSGGGTVTPQAPGAPPIQLDLGVAKTASYSVVANDYASGGVRTLTGTQRIGMAKVIGTPLAGQYAFNAATGAYAFAAADAGAVVTISYSTVFSLYYFETVQPAEVPLLSPYQISTNNQEYFWSDGGVINVQTGLPLTYGASTQGYTQSGGVYTFTSDLAGVYVYIRYTYTSSDSSVTNTSTLNLTFFGGTLGQAPNSYWQSKYPGSAFGYPGICHVDANPMALGESAVLPSYNYEVVGLNIFPGGGLDAHFCDVFRTHLYDAFLGVGFPTANVDAWTSCYAYWAANGYLGKIKLDTQTSVASAMKEVIETGNAGAVWSGGLLKLIPYGDTTCVGNGYTYTPNTTPVATLTNNDLLPSSDKKAGESSSDDPVQWEIKAPQDCWNYVQAQYCNRANDYNNELINEQNDAFISKYGRRIESSQTWDWITTAAAAQWALNLRLKRKCYITNTCKLWLSYRFSYLEPMDMITLPTGENIRITQITDDPNGRLAIEAEQWTYGSSTASLYAKQAPSSYQLGLSQALPGNTYAAIFEATPQSVLAKPNTIQIAVAGDSPSWGGCRIYVSSDGLTYSQVAMVNALGRVGLLSASLASAADPDTTDTLAVDMTMSGGELVTATKAQADNFATLAALVDQGGTMELISFETATLTATNRYNLTYLRRGVYGTTIGVHLAGAEFSYIGSSGVNEYQYPYQYVGKTVYFKFASFNLAGNQLQPLSACAAVSYTIKGTTLQPPSSGSFATNPASVLTASTAGSSSQIAVAGFLASLSGQTVACNVASPITGLTPGQLYYVYYIDLAWAGGNISPIATANPTDYIGKVGYYALGSVITPASGSIYRPSTYSDNGTTTTSSPQNAYDSSLTTCAQAYATTLGTMPGGTVLIDDCVWEGFSATTLGAAKTLTVSAAFQIGGGGGGSTVLRASLNNGTSWTTLETAASNVAQANYTLTVPSGTLLSNVLVEVKATPSSSVSNQCGAFVYDINIQ